MPHPSIRFVAAFTLLGLSATAQFTHVIPNGFANVEANSGNYFPWSSTSTLWPGLRTSSLYDSTNFTNASINFPILVTRLRWRADSTSSAWTGGTFANVTVQMATAAVDAMSPSNGSFAANFGPDLATVYAGSVTILPGSSSSPGPWAVDVALTTPFLYDPSLGDLAIDVDIDNTGGNSWGGGTSPYLDIDASATTLASRIVGNTAYPGVSFTGTPHGIVCEVTYLPASGAALATPFGTGCYASASSFYESFAANSFDLSNTGMQFIPSGGGYIVIPSAPAFVTPTSTSLGLGNDAVSSARVLPFTFNYPGGSTTSVFVSSNGFVWLQPNTAAGCCVGNASQLLSQAARFAPLWADLDPSGGGAVHFDVDVPNGIAYVTWLNVPETGQSNANSVQLALHSDGRVDYCYQSCALSTHTGLVGWSPGGGARDPGGVDLSASLPVITAADVYPLALAANQRPVLGTNIVLTTSRIPASTPLGVVALGLQQFTPGIPLGVVGAAGCFQYSSIANTTVFVPSGSSGTVPLGVPNNGALAGRHIYGQSVTLTPGLNPLGLITSNGLDLLLNPQ